MYSLCPVFVTGLILQVEIEEHCLNDKSSDLHIPDWRLAREETSLNLLSLRTADKVLEL